MWSIYDTCILVTGLISTLIAVIPKKDIPMKTRATAAAVGLGLIAASLYLGGLRSFRYPSAVFLGPPAALCALLAIALPDKKSTRPAESPISTGIDSQGVDQAPAEAVAQQPTSPPGVNLGQASAAAQPIAVPAPVPDQSERTAVWAEVHDPETASERLAEIAGQYPEFAAAIVNHPNCYPALAEWARASGLLDVRE